MDKTTVMIFENEIFENEYQLSEFITISLESKKIKSSYRKTLQSLTFSPTHNMTFEIVFRPSRTNASGIASYRTNIQYSEI